MSKIEIDLNDVEIYCNQTTQLKNGNAKLLEKVL